MRDIKFKAWDKKSKKMRDVSSIAFHNKRELWHKNENNTPKVINVWGYDIIFEKDIVLHREEEDVTLLEYTGLKDKNGNHIYEGDILKVSTASSERGNWKVYFEMGSYDAKRIHDDYIEDLVDVVIDCEGVNQCELIGNIYENPELLESEAK